MNLTISSRAGTLDDRFNRRTKRQGECLVWLGGKNTSGYGTIVTSSRVKVCAHRLSYERSVGPIPAGMVVDHICRNKACVDPSHLRLATTKQNGENLTGATARSTTGVRGVQFVWSRGKSGGIIGYRGKAMHNGKVHHAGSYKTLAEAEAAVIALRNKLYTHNDLDRVA